MPRALVQRTTRKNKVMNNRFLKPTDSENHSGKVELLDLAAIRCDCGTQIRASIHETTVGEYAEAMNEGAEFPHIVVFHDGNQYTLADGFHRVMASARQGYTQIHAEVRQGTKSDALKYALGANAKHGLKRTNADKRRSVELALAEWPKVSDRQIAELCAVGYSLVAEVRKIQLPDSGSCRIGADGKQRRIPQSNRISATADHHPAANGEHKNSHGGVITETEEDRPRIKTHDEEIKELRVGIAGIKSEVEYHMELVRADAEIILGRIHDDLIEPDDLKDCATELRFAAKKVEDLRSALEWPDIKQSSPLN
jgi:hypothetical protein